MNKTTESSYSKFRVLFKNLVNRCSIRLYGSYKVLKEVQNHLPAPGSLVIDEIDKANGRSTDSPQVTCPQMLVPIVTYGEHVIFLPSCLHCPSF